MLEPNGRGLFHTPSNGLSFRARRTGGVKPAVRPRDIIAQRVAERKASLAEYVANGGSINNWSRENGMSTSGGGRLWREIVAEMGWQAQ